MFTTNWARTIDLLGPPIENVLIIHFFFRFLLLFVANKTGEIHNIFENTIDFSNFTFFSYEVTRNLNEVLHEISVSDISSVINNTCKSNVIF